MIDHRLKTRLQMVADRQHRLRLWGLIASCWAGAALLGALLILVQRQTGWASALSLPLVAMFGVAGSIVCAIKLSRVQPDWRELARRIETRHPDLDGRLVTALEVTASQSSEMGYLQDRVVQETVQHAQTHVWDEVVPGSWLGMTKAGHWLALIAFGCVLWGLRTTRGHSLLGSVSEVAVSVSPGDTSLERGSSLVVLARFDAALPPNVELVIGPPGSTGQHIPLIRSLADPIFGGSVPEVATNLVYHVEYAGKRTREYHASVFEFPRLERADADLRFPDYTGLPAKRIENTKRVTAVENSRLDLTLRLNKPVVSARLVPRDQDRAAIPLLVETNRPVAAVKDFPLEKSQPYSLQLVDAEGRTNKAPILFVFEVVTNRIPELRLTSPRGDIRPSPLEEITFEGTVWDDFGVKAYGLAYTLAGQDAKFVELGGVVSAREKHPFKHVLRLEELGVQPDNLVAWFVWADDLGPDGQLRRSSGDLFFGEVRPFEEVFREGQGQDGSAGGQSGGQSESQTTKLAELQKQIISATWKLQRQRPAPAKPQSGLRKGKNDALAVLHKPSAEGGPTGKVLITRPRLAVMGQVARDQAAPDSGVRRTRVRGGAAQTNSPAPTLASDAVVIRDSQAQALEQAQAASEEQNDPRTTLLWSAAKLEMEKALAHLQKVTNAPDSFADALAAEQGAYQALLKLQQHEYQVMRNQNRNQQGGGGRQDQLQRQLDQMEMTQAENRYETQRQAQAQQNPERREQLQVQNRLQELARRQQDVNDRLKELQTALQEAQTEAERQEIQRRLKRLQEEEQQMLADVDELRQRMDRAENQSQMSQQRQQLDQTREDVQRAADAAAQGTPAQALASGTRAQRQLQELRDQMRKENSNQFAEDLRDMRGQARELAQKQEEILRQMQSESPAGPRKLADATDSKELIAALNRQKERVTNLVERATQMSQQAEEGEPVLSRQLYETVRKYSQDTAQGVKDAQDDLLNRGQMTRSLYQRIKESSEPESARLLDLSAGLLQEGMTPQAADAGQRARAGLDELKRGVERAAGNVLGDDTESLRLAQQELDQLMDQLQKEMAQNGEGSGTNQAKGLVAGDGKHGIPDQPGQPGQTGQANPPDVQGKEGDTPGNQPGNQANAQSPGAPGQTSSKQPGQGQGETAAGENPQNGQSGNQPSQGQATQTASGSRNEQSSQEARQRGGIARSGQRNSLNGGAGSEGRGGDGGYFAPFYDESGGPLTGPILTGENFTPWSDRLRDVEEMIELPELRNQVATARDRARQVRQEFRRDQKKPDWAVVRLQVVKPLVEVRDRIADELARRQSNEALVPIDRDPVPARYSELVRRYYEELGKEK